MFNVILVSLLAAAPEWQPTVDAVVPMYRQLHTTPELSGQELKTSAALSASLQKLGFTIFPKIGGAGFVATLRNRVQRSICFTNERALTPTLSRRERETLLPLSPGPLPAPQGEGFTGRG